MNRGRQGELGTARFRHARRITDVDGVHLSKDVGERTGKPAGTATDFGDLHPLWAAPLAYVPHVRQDLLIHSGPPESKYSESHQGSLSLAM